MKFKKIRILILQFDLGNPRHNKKLFFRDANFSPAAPDNKRLAVVSKNEIRRDGGKFIR